MYRFKAAATAEVIMNFHSIYSQNDFTIFRLSAAERFYFSSNGLMYQFDTLIDDFLNLW